MKDLAEAVFVSLPFTGADDCEEAGVSLVTSIISRSLFSVLDLGTSRFSI
jgi:hypothetical protein